MALLSITPTPASIPLVFADDYQQNKFQLKVLTPSAVQNVNIYLSIKVKNVTVIRAYPSIYTSGSTHIADVDVNEILAGLWTKIVERDLLVDNQFTFPADPMAPLQGKTANYLLDATFSVAFSNVVGDKIIQSAWYTEENFKTKIVRGGLSRMMVAYLSSIAQKPCDYFYNNKKFVSWMPDNAVVHPRQPIRLFFFNKEAAALTLKSKVYFTDGTNQTITYNTNPALLLECAVGGMDLRLQNIDINKIIERYTIWLESSSWTSEEKTFVMDHSYYEFNDLFFFRNSLGFFETFWSRGYRNEGLRVNREESSRAYAVAKFRKGSLFSNRGSFSRPFSSNTGYLTLSMKNWVADFLNSPDVFLPAGFSINPVIIEGGSPSLAKGGSDLFSADYKFKIAHEEKFFSDQPPIVSPFGDFNEDFNEDFFI